MNYIMGRIFYMRKNKHIDHVMKTGFKLHDLLWNSRLHIVVHMQYYSDLI